MNIEQYANKHPKTRSGVILPENIQLIDQMPAISKILDIGCAEGHTIRWLRTLFPGRYQLIGIDLSQVRIKKALEDKSHSAIFCTGSAEALPIADGVMQFVIASQVIEHVPDDVQMLREIDRVLVPGGRFQIDTVYKKKWARYFYRSPAGWAIDPTHIREYTDIESFISKFPTSLKVTSINLMKTYRRINLIRFLSFLPDWVRIRIPGYFTFFVSGQKNN